MFFNKKTVYGGITFESKSEADYAPQLNLMRIPRIPETESTLGTTNPISTHCERRHNLRLRPRLP
jgi:hypothetical protein